MEQRINELDYLKSIFILLMVAFHLVYIGDNYPYSKQIVYTFHMSGFLIISGYLAVDSTGKSIRSFARKLLWIIIPYAVMETGYVIASCILPVREAVTEITPAILLSKIFVSPLGPYWYLHTLIICSLIQYCVFHWLRMKTLSRLIVFGLALFAISCCGGLIVFANAIYFLAGTIIKQCKLPFTRVIPPSLPAVVPLVVLCCFPDNLDRGTLAGVVITYLSVSTLLYIHNYLPRLIRQYFYFIGRNTLVILLFSPVFTIISKAFLPFLLFEPTGMLFMVISVVFAIGGCIAIAWTMDKLRLSRFFFGKDVILNRQ
ncbi:acyltransferase family protein [Bacteroides sp. UBA939]|uniref:acyltransferase family protein n=1 Tax=Bacteroides sp. UBA939 TaxID=1946092 RepID=UPI0025C517C7|nr:acyltransferase [Bacteroides sp. UBA939]